MMEHPFKVNEIINGGEFTVTPNWVWERKMGNKVSVLGFRPPTHKQEYGYNFAKNKLELLLNGKNVALCKPTFIDKYGEDVLFCYVYLDDINISNYFPEFKSKN